MGDLISRSALIERIKDHKKVIRSGNHEIDLFYGWAHDHIIELVKNTPTAYDVAVVVEKMREQTVFLEDCTKYGNKNAEQMHHSYSTMMMYEVAEIVEDLIDLVEGGTTK